MGKQPHKDEQKSHKEQREEIEREEEERRKEEKALDEALKDSFPASDPLPTKSTGRPGGVKRDRGG